MMKSNKPSPFCRLSPITTGRERKRNSMKGSWDWIGTRMWVVGGLVFSERGPDIVTSLLPTCESPILRARGILYY